jgi:ferrous iron transport protein B
MKEEHKHGHKHKHRHEHHSEYPVVYSDQIEDKIDEISELLVNQYGEIDNLRWHAIKLMEQDQAIVAKYPLDLSAIITHSYEEEIINQKYDFIEEIIEEVVVNKHKKAASTDKIDRLLTHKILDFRFFWGLWHWYSSSPSRSVT